MASPTSSRAILWVARLSNVEEPGRVPHRAQNRNPGLQNLPEKCLLVREIPVDERRRLQTRLPRDALDRRPLEALRRELLECRLQNLRPPVRLLSQNTPSLIVQSMTILLIERSVKTLKSGRIGRRGGRRMLSGGEIW